MIRCVNRRDTRWIATWCRLSASWTPNQPQRPKQTESAASTGEIRSTDASSNAGLIRTGSWGTHLCIRLIYKEYYRNPESSEAFLYPGSIAIAPESALSEMFVFDHARRGGFLLSCKTKGQKPMSTDATPSSGPCEHCAPLLRAFAPLHEQVRFRALWIGVLGLLRAPT